MLSVETVKKNIGIISDVDVPRRCSSGFWLEYYSKITSRHIRAEQIFIFYFKLPSYTFTEPIFQLKQLVIR